MKTIEVDNRYVDIFFAVLFIGLFAGAFVVSLAFEPPVLSGDPGAAFFPQLICTVSLFFSVILLFQRIFRAGRSSSKGRTSIDLPPFLASFFLVAGLIFAMVRIGSEISFFSFLFILMGWRTGKWFWAFMVAIVSTIVLYGVFVILLNVHLPLLFLPKYVNF